MIQNLRPYYTYMHICSGTFGDSGYRRWCDSTLITHDNVRFLRLKHREDTNRKQGHHQAPWKVMIHQIIMLAVWGKGHCKAEALRCGKLYYKIKLRFPEPIMKRPEGRDWFHLVFSSSRVQTECTLPSSLWQIQYQISAYTVQPSPALIHPYGGIPLHKMRFIIIYVVRHKRNCSWN